MISTADLQFQKQLFKKQHDDLCLLKILYRFKHKSRSQSHHLLNEALQIIYKTKITEMIKMTYFFQISSGNNKKQQSVFYNFQSPSFSSIPFTQIPTAYILD